MACDCLANADPDPNDEPWFLMSWREWVGIGGDVRPGRMIQLTTMPVVEQEYQGDGHWYRLHGCDKQNFHYDKEWLPRDDLVMELLRHEWPDVTFALPDDPKSNATPRKYLS